MRSKPKSHLAIIAVALTAAFEARTTLAFQRVPPSPPSHRRCRSRRSDRPRPLLRRDDDTGASSSGNAGARFAGSTSILPSLYNDDDDNDDDCRESSAIPPLLPVDPVGIVFDMDGTLIRHSIDFAEMRRRIYEIADDDPIGRTLERECVLALATKLSPAGAERCGVVFADVERRALEEMDPMEGGVALVEFLRRRGVRRAVLTRNVGRNAEAMADEYLDRMTGADRGGGEGGGGFAADGPVFHPIVARDTPSNDGRTMRSKPHPDGILHVCEVWGCDPKDVIMVGDSANDDVAAANRAGCGGSVLLTQPGGKELDTDSGYTVGNSEEEIEERTPSLRVESLVELQDCLEALLEERDSDVVVNGGGTSIVDEWTTLSEPIV